MEELLAELELHTVCHSAKCPNRGECFSEGTATFLVMGDACTRSCRFCAVESRAPAPLDPSEPARVAEAVRRLSLSHVVVTMVTRDDLPDGGSAHMAAVIRAVKAEVPAAAVEVLTSDFGGMADALATVLEAGPDVFNHNLETVPRLYGEVRPEADYRRSLEVLERAHALSKGIPTKSGLMLGLGERFEEVIDVLGDLRDASVRILTLGQYLQPSDAHLAVREFITPDVFAALSREAYRMGFTSVASAPFVRSSYRASEAHEDDRAS